MGARLHIAVLERGILGGFWRGFKGYSGGRENAEGAWQHIPQNRLGPLLQHVSRPSFCAVLSIKIIKMYGAGVYVVMRNLSLKLILCFVLSSCSGFVQLQKSQRIAEWQG